MTASFKRPLPAKALRWRCAPSRFRWESTAEATPLVETIGQDEAIEALRLGIELYGPGYNVYVAGLPGLGKTSVVTGLLVEMSPVCALPPDRVYVNRFKDPSRPLLIELPRGDGRRLQQEMGHAIEFVAERIRRLADDEAFVRRRAEAIERSRAAERKVTDEFEARCRAEGFAPAVSTVAGATEPDVVALLGDRQVPVPDLDDA